VRGECGTREKTGEERVGGLLVGGGIDVLGEKTLDATVLPIDNNCCARWTPILNGLRMHAVKIGLASG
jgi:hypothetical protein